MKVISFEVFGLFGRQTYINLNFDSDMNILTGRNGAGKTSVMKLMWYIISGNIEYALSEINFSKAILVTDEYSCTLFKLNKNTCKVELVNSEGFLEVFEDIHSDDGDTFQNAEDNANVELFNIGSSVFLPTFRRIEGGFSLRPNRGLYARVNRSKSDIEDGLLALSKKMSNVDHTFVTSISSTDIVEILLRKYANLSEISNDYQQDISLEIIERIRAYEDSVGVNSQSRASEVLSEVKKKVESIEKTRSEIMSPMEELRVVVEKLFKHVGIRIDSRLNFGAAAGAVHSDELSAGEKQMLSFLCYNAFYSDSIIFIDEPELSLHVDWQRQLFTILKRQNSTNQFIIATHSPFIYSKYPNKELSLDSDRGDSELSE